MNSLRYVAAVTIHIIFTAIYTVLAFAVDSTFGSIIFAVAALYSIDAIVRRVQELPEL